jgi:uncharacterized membrane protein
MAQGIGTRFDGSGYLLGFALGGFFDGILLHQILQWHHLLSAIDGTDIRFQVAADGYFHALMYVIAAIGLWLLWTALRSPGHHAGRRLFAAMLIGFGGWHIADAVLSHWLIGIHRIRMDSENPLVWDLLWLAIFGIIPLLAGLWMRKGQGGGGTRQPVRRAIVPLLATLLVTGAGAQALRPASGSDFTTVLFRPGTSPQTVFAAIAAADGRLVWADRTGQLVLIRMEDGRSGWSLFRHGAILVSGAGLPSGCLNALRIDS